MKVKKNLLKLIFYLFFVINCYGQIEKPKYILASNFFYSHNSMGIVVRYDKGIDSINIPIDTNKIKINLLKLDIEGKKISDNYIYYEYQFTPKIDGFYKIPNGKIWSKNNLFDMVFKDSIKLKIPNTIIKISSSDSIALENNKIVELKIEEKKRAECTINSRIKESVNTITVIAWTDKLDYKVNDEIRIIVECNNDFDKEKLELKFKNNSKNNLYLLRTCRQTIYENNIEKHHIIFIFKSINTGIIKISPINILINGKVKQTNDLIFNVKK
jgi:hypothetical protein